MENGLAEALTRQGRLCVGAIAGLLNLCGRKLNNHVTLRVKIQRELEADSKSLGISEEYISSRKCRVLQLLRVINVVIAMVRESHALHAAFKRRESKFKAWRFGKP